MKHFDGHSPEADVIPSRDDQRPNIIYIVKQQFIIYALYHTFLSIIHIKHEPCSYLVTHEQNPHKIKFTCLFQIYLQK